MKKLICYKIFLIQGPLLRGWTCDEVEKVCTVANEVINSPKVKKKNKQTKSLVFLMSRSRVKMMRVFFSLVS